MCPKEIHIERDKAQHRDIEADVPARVYPLDRVLSHKCPHCQNLIPRHEKNKSKNKKGTYETRK